MAKVVAAMSGGVDSSVTAALLLEQGHEVIGVHMKLHDTPDHEVPGHCCGLDDAMDARRVADSLGIPFYVMNLQDAFRKAVMDDLADTYLAGETPNPCIRCNGVLKFRVLLSRAMALGATHLATGHYAQIMDGPTGPMLQMAKDPNKDQTYFLFPVTQKALAKTMFPLGHMTKPEVRAHAHRLGLLTASKPESQEICFIPDDDHARFVREHRPDADCSGDIVLPDGTVVGTHDGYFRFTIGQRRGIGVALGKPAYVTAIESDTHRVVVSTDTSILDHGGLVARDCNWYHRPEPGTPITARIRHNGGFVPAVIEAGDPVRVRFLTPARAVAPGQAVVFYDGDRVLGGGWITRSLPAEAFA